jgi:ubiquinone/menaquinone biosynthesis C-methylase UbiE
MPNSNRRCAEFAVPTVTVAYFFDRGRNAHRISGHLAISLAGGDADLREPLLPLLKFRENAMLDRVLEPEAMDSLEEAIDYDNMDHVEVNRRFVDDLILAAKLPVEPIEEDGEDSPPLELLDLGTGTAQIPVELCRRTTGVVVIAIDLATQMLQIAKGNVAMAGLLGRIMLDRVDAKSLPYEDGRFAGIISNSIVHHIPDPAPVLAEAVRVTASGGTLFLRDLARPDDDAELDRLVELYTAGANDHQRQMFRDSLHAALTVPEVLAIVATFGADPASVQMTSDRHWTWAWTKP